MARVATKAKKGAEAERIRNFILDNMYAFVKLSIDKPVPLEMQEVFSNSDYVAPKYRRKLTQHPGLLEKTEIRLAKDEAVEVREDMARKAWSRGAHEIQTVDKHFRVRAIAHRNPKLEKDLCSELDNDPDERVKLSSQDNVPLVALSLRGPAIRARN